MRPSFDCIFTVLSCLLNAMLSVAQIPGMKTYTQLDGFPGAVGYIVMQDARGFIWIGTDNGVACFDGRQFEVFDASDGLVDKEIIMAVPDMDSTVLFMPLLNNYAYYRNGRVITARQNPGLNKICNKKLNRVFADQATGRLWISDIGSADFYRIDRDSLEAIRIPVPEEFNPFLLFAGKIYYASGCGIRNTIVLFCHDLNSGNTAQITTVSGSGQFLATSVSINNDATLISIAAPETQVVTVYRLRETQLMTIARVQSPHTVKRMIIDANDHLWIIFEEGGFGYAGPVDEDMASRPVLTFLPGTMINDVYVDRDRHIWITTSFKGLHFISAKHWANTLMTYPLDLPKAVPQKLTMYKDGDILLSYYNEPVLSRINRFGSSTVHRNPIARDGFRCFQQTSEGLAIASNFSFELLKEQDGRMGTAYSSDALGSVKDMALDASNRLLISSSHGAFYCYGDSMGELPRFESAFNGRTSCIESLGDNTVLIGTPNGVYYDERKGQEPQPVNHPLLSLVHITDIAAIGENAALIGTNAQGLFRYQPLTGSIDHLLTPEDLEDSHIRQIHVQSDSSFWLATDNGIFHVRTDALRVHRPAERYTFFDGLPSNNVSDICVMNDTLYAATSAGLAIIPLRGFPAGNAVPPHTWVRSARVGDRIIHFPEHLETTYLENDFVFSLSAISYESFNRIRYRYRLDNWSPRWMETEGSEISFSNLPPGSYVLHIQALNFAGVAGPLVTTTIEVFPAFWQTWWFRAITVLLTAFALVLLLYLWAKKYRKRLELEVQRKKQLARLELEAIKAQINPHFISNCLNSIQYFHLKQDYKQATEYFNLFAKLIHHTLEYSQETFITLAEEIEYLSDYLQLEKVRFKDGMHHCIEVEGSLDRSLLLPAMLIQPHVENALKHGILANDGRGAVIVCFSGGSAGGMEVRITDDGPGLQQDAATPQQGHMGLRLSKSRAETYRQLFDCAIEITIKDRKSECPPARGTQVTLHIPPFSHAKTGT